MTNAQIVKTIALALPKLLEMANAGKLARTFVSIPEHGDYTIEVTKKM